MYTIKTNFNHASVACETFSRGINKSITLQQGRLASKAILSLNSEVEAVRKAVKARASDFNKRSQEFKGGEDKPLSPELMEEKDAVESEISELYESEITMELGNDQYIALCTVMDEVSPAVFKLMQDANDKPDVKAPTIQEFQWLEGFIEDLQNASKKAKED